VSSEMTYLRPGFSGGFWYWWAFK